MNQSITIVQQDGNNRRPIFVSLALILIYPFYSVPVQRATAPLIMRLGPFTARVLTEGAIWLYFAVVVAVALFWERRLPRNFGLRRFTPLTLLVGLAGAILLFTAGQLGSLLVYDLPGRINHADAQTNTIVGGSIVYAIFLAVRAGVIEETLFRGLAIEQLTTLTGNRLLAAATAMFAFIFIHALRFDWVQLIPIGFVSIAVTGLYLWRRDLVVNIIAHAVLDAVGLVTASLNVGHTH